MCLLIVCSALFPNLDISLTPCLKTITVNYNKYIRSIFLCYVMIQLLLIASATLSIFNAP